MDQASGSTRGALSPVLADSPGHRIWGDKMLQRHQAEAVHHDSRRRVAPLAAQVRTAERWNG